MCETCKKHKEKKVDDKKPEGEKQPAGAALAIPCAHFASMIGEGFDGPYPF